MEFESYFDAKLRKNGKSIVITVPSETIEKIGLNAEDIIEVAVVRRDGED
jgi:antitoxin component of MazEF toxin-antitoxin module